MTLIRYGIVNRSSTDKTFSYFVDTVPATIVVPGNSTRNFEGDIDPEPVLVGIGVTEEAFLSDSYIPDPGQALLWNDGNKVKHIKIANTPVSGPSISPIITNTQYLEFTMVGAKDSEDNFLYPNSPTVPKTERYVIGGANKQTDYSILDINTRSSSTTKAVFADISSADTGFSYFDKQFLIPTNCSPLSNNAVEPRANEWLQDVDYSVDALKPINIKQLIDFTALRATVPQSNYTQLGFSNSRYIGSSTTRDKINEYNPKGISDPINTFLYNDEKSYNYVTKGKGPSLGKIPNIELNNAYIAYFNKIIDPYPTLNNKTAYYIKYLIDENGTIFDPTLSDINYSIFTETFKLVDYDSEPTRTKISIQNIEETKELSKLTNNLPSIFEIGKYPVPILYSQTSSLGHVNEITLSGSLFYSTLGIGKTFSNYGIDIYALQNDATQAIDRENPQTDLNINTLEFTPSDITPFADDSIIPTSSLETSGGNNFAILFPLDENGKGGELPGNPLSDEYRIEGSFTFTTSTMPGEYVGGDSKNNYLTLRFDERRPEKTNPFWVTINQYRKDYPDGDSLENYIRTNQGFSIPDTGVKLIITENPGSPNQTIHPPLTISQLPPSYGKQWDITSNGFTLQPNSLYIEDLIIKEIKGYTDVRKGTNRRSAVNLIAGGWATSGGNNYGIGAIPIKYDWVVEFEVNNFTQYTGTYLSVNGNINFSQDGDKTTFRTRPKDVFLFFGANGERENNLQWKRTFNPTYATGINTKPILKYKVVSSLAASSDNKNKAQGPFWRKYSDTTVNELYMSSSILNQAYDSSFIQAKLQYEGASNTDFPLTIEPDFIEFDPVTDFWKLELGDEIRFINNEKYVYTIIDIINPKNPTSESPEDKLRVTVSPSFNTNPLPDNLDFFVVRRWKENKNFLILDQQKPYGFPVSQSSSPGIILPEHRIDKFNINPDLVLKELIEKSII